MLRNWQTGLAYASCSGAHGGFLLNTLTILGIVAIILGLAIFFVPPLLWILVALALIIGGAFAVYGGVTGRTWLPR